MAIDPKLVSIKKASDLPSGIPTSTGEFLYFEDETLKKAEMSDLYDRLESSYLGVITPSSTIPATGSWYGSVLEPATFNNVTPAITVAAADFDVQNGTANNEVRIIISEGVATKDVRRVKGEVGPEADPAKLPLYSAIKSADIVAGTQFIDDENGNIIYRVLAGQTLAVGELPANFPLKVESMGVDVDEKTFVGKNLANPALIVDGQWINSSGDFANLAGWKVIKHVPVTPNTNVTFSGHDPAGVSKYVLFEDINKVKIGAPSNSLSPSPKVVNIPANCYYISASIKNTSNVDPTNLQIEYGTVATSFEAYTETFAVEKINSNKILASYFQKFEVGNTYKKDEVVYDSGKIYLSKIDGNTALVTDTASWLNIGGTSGYSYDQSLNTTDDVAFDTVTANEVNINGVLKKGTLASPPVGLLTSEYWLDTTDSAINPILRQKQ